MRKKIFLILAVVFLIASVFAIATVNSSDIMNTQNMVKPLTAADLTWSVLPAYDYQKIVPLRGNSFSDIGSREYANGDTAINEIFYEMSFPGYSNLPQYYHVQASDGTWRLYYMPLHIDSGDIPIDDPTNVFPNPVRYDGGGILNYAEWDGMTVLPEHPEPWHLFEIAERGGGSIGVYYDTYTRQGLLWSNFYDTALTPISQTALHKPYPAGRLNTQSTGINMDTSVEIPETDERYQDVETALESTVQEFPKGYIDTDGQPITDFIYEQAEDFSEGIAACCMDGKWGYIDETGTAVTDFIYDGVWYNTIYDEESACYVEAPTAYPCSGDTMVVWKDGQVGLLYRDGSLLIDFGQVEDMAPAFNNELWAKQNGLWGLIDLADAKRKMGLSPDLTAPASTELPRPAASTIS